MYIVLFEGLGNLKSRAEGAVINRFRELSSIGTILFGSSSKPAQLWEIFQAKPYPGDAFFAYKTLGKELGSRSVAFLEPVFVESGKLTEKTGRIDEGTYEIAGRAFTVEKGFLLYKGSTKVKLDEASLKYVPLSKDAKETAKLLNLFAKKIQSRFGLFPKLWDFSRYVRPEKRNFEFYSRDKILREEASFMSAKLRSLKEIIASDADLKVIHTKEEKEIMPLLVKGEKEDIAIINFGSRIGEILLYGPSFGNKLWFQIDASTLATFLELEL